jgi:hypothetical protein
MKLFLVISIAMISATTTHTIHKASSAEVKSSGANILARVYRTVDSETGGSNWVSYSGTYPNGQEITVTAFFEKDGRRFYSSMFPRTQKLPSGVKIEYGVPVAVGEQGRYYTLLKTEFMRQEREKEAPPMRT